MKLEINTKSLALTPQVIIPITKTKKLKKQLADLATWTGLDKKMLRQDFDAAKNAVFSFYFKNGRTTHKVYLLGIGENWSKKSVETTFQKFAIQYQKQLDKTLGIRLIESKLATPQYLEAVASGLQLATYNIGHYKSSKKETHPLATKQAKLVAYLPTKLDKAVALKALQKGLALAETTMEILQLVNAPSNKKLPKTLADWAVASGKKYGYQVTVLDKPAIEKLGLHALLAVNRGSENPPRFIIMEYVPSTKSESTPKIGLVGKGVTFDTGGLSIKGSQNMHYMKSDMGGAAAVLGTLEAAARLQLQAHVIGIVPTTDNSVDALAIKPGDVIDSYSGKTIEVIDTDAEGRLILSDGLAYILKHHQPDVLIDLATLTGSCVRALGYAAAGLFSNNDKLASQLIEAGKETGEQLWQLPLWDSYFEDMQSDVADVKNLGARPIAGAIKAAKFLEFFTQKHPAWAHMDIAGVAFGNSLLSKDKSATGFGIKLLTEFIAKWK